MDSSEDWAPTQITPASVHTEATAGALLDYLDSLRDFGAELTAGKALVFSGFRIGPADIDAVMDRVVPGRLSYVHGNSPRTKVGAQIYTSTEYPPEYVISMHNELSYSHKWPTRLAFYCEIAAATGGATPVVDGARWLDALDSEVRDAFADGVRYTQNLHGGQGFGRSWQATFETEDRDIVESFLRAPGTDFQWRPDGGLRISQHRPAFLNHPATGQAVWFNQADQWHPAMLGDRTAAALAALMPAEDLPQSVCLSDGSPIPEAHVRQVRERGLAAAVDVLWQPGDLMVIDNVAVGHGRRPYTGRRRVLVAMCA